jgi:hypothetical protein
MITAVLAAAVHFATLTAARAAVARLLTVETVAGATEIALTYRVAAEDGGNTLHAELVGAEVWYDGVDRADAIPVGPEALRVLGVDPHSADLGRLLAWEMAEDCIRRASAAAG